MNRLQGKVALVSGAANGIGRRTAELFAQEGAVVYLSDIMEEAGRAAAQNIGHGATFVSHDVTSEQAWIDIIGQIEKEHGRLDVLVNNAGISPAGSIEETTLELWKKVMAINTDSVFLGCKHAFGLMKLCGGGSIINLSSMVALRAGANLAAYSASKGAVRVLTQAVALHGGPHKIRCNSVHPGPVHTRMLDDFLKASPDPEAVKKAFAEGLPLGRSGEPEDIANGIVYLASDESSWVTGAVLSIDGGAIL